jgi:hypothetical protein
MIAEPDRITDARLEAAVSLAAKVVDRHGAAYLSILCGSRQNSRLGTSRAEPSPAPRVWPARRPGQPPERAWADMYLHLPTVSTAGFTRRLQFSSARDRP